MSIKQSRRKRHCDKVARPQSGRREQNRNYREDSVSRGSLSGITAPFVIATRAMNCDHTLRFNALVRPLAQ